MTEAGMYNDRATTLHLLVHPFTYITLQLWHINADRS